MTKPKDENRKVPMKYIPRSMRLAAEVDILAEEGDLHDNLIKHLLAARKIAGFLCGGCTSEFVGTQCAGCAYGPDGLEELLNKCLAMVDD